MKALRSLVLASSSPRRADILSRMGLRFEIVTADVDERVRHGGPPANVAKRLAELKASSMSSFRPLDAVLAADTVVDVDGDILGKPADVEDARRMLWRLSGRTHEVHTGVAVAFGGAVESRVESTSVQFHELRSAEIERYVASGLTADKAGAYGIQDRGFSLVSGVRGSYWNVVGLPVLLTGALLLRAGAISADTAARLKAMERQP